MASPPWPPCFHSPCPPRTMVSEVDAESQTMNLDAEGDVTTGAQESAGCITFRSTGPSAYSKLRCSTKTVLTHHCHTQKTDHASSPQVYRSQIIVNQRAGISRLVPVALLDLREHEIEHESRTSRTNVGLDSGHAMRHRRSLVWAQYSVSEWDHLSTGVTRAAVLRARPSAPYSVPHEFRARLSALTVQASTPSHCAFGGFTVSVSNRSM